MKQQKEEITEETNEEVEVQAQEAEGEEESKEASKEPTLEDQLEEARDKYLRLYSEFENFRRRTAKERISLNDKQRSLNALHSGLTYEVSRKDSIHQDLLGIYYNLSALYQELGRFDEAGKFLNLAGRVTQTRLGGDIQAQTRYLYREGIYHREVGNFKESLDALNQAIENGKEVGDSISIALQIELGTTYRHFGDLNKSEQELLTAIEMAKGTDEIQYFRAIDRLSALKIEQGEYSDSENYLLYNLEKKNHQLSG